MTVGGRYNHATIKLDGQDRLFPGSQCHQQIRALQSDGGRQLQAAAGPLGLWRLLGIEPCADAGRTRLRRARKSVPHRELPDRRSAAGAGGRAHGRDRSARTGVSNGGPLHLVGGPVPHARVRRHPAHHGRQSHLLRECRRYAAPGRRAVRDVRDAQVEVYAILCLRRCHARHVHQSRRQGQCAFLDAGDRLPGIPRIASRPASSIG